VGALGRIKTQRPLKNAGGDRRLVKPAYQFGYYSTTEAVEGI
jgi:hypothetical protein